MAIPPKDLIAIRMETREHDAPFFSDITELEYYYDKNNKDVNATIYELLILKSQDSTLQVSGLSTTDTSAYFKMLASKFSQFNSGTLR